jgi:hypothetical protein
MPTLEICDASGLITQAGIAKVFAIMLYPSEREAGRRQGFESRVLLEAASKYPFPDGTIPCDAKLLQCALGSEPHPLAPGGRWKRWTEGTIAGEQLALNMRLAHHVPEHASRRKVIYLLEWHCYLKKIPGSASDFKRIWSEYNSVAHFWAAFNLRSQRFQKIEKFGYTASHDGARFLEEAEGVRLWAENFRPTPTNLPLLSGNKTWRLPSQFRPVPQNPDWPPTGRVRIPGIPTWMLERLKQFPKDPAPQRAPGRRPKGV